MDLTFPYPQGQGLTGLKQSFESVLCFSNLFRSGNNPSLSQSAWLFLASAIDSGPSMWPNTHQREKLYTCNDGEKQLSVRDGGMCALGFLQNHFPTQSKPALEASAHRPPKRLRITTRTLITHTPPAVRSASGVFSYVRQYELDLLLLATINILRHTKLNPRLGPQMSSAAD